ncbi:MAG: hypothetical protein K940chlam8_00113 [Chlamydiae bacterium]|nr:hypothetical protein [Chlamydiota bacterium]
MRKIVPIFLSVLVFFGCQKKEEATFSKYFDDGRAKPTIALLPMKSNANPNLPWNVVQELESSLKNELLQMAGLYVLGAEQTENGIFNLNNTDLLSEKNTLHTSFHPAEFVVQLELIDHQEAELLQKGVQTSNSTDIAKVLNLKMRLMVVDIRSVTPKVILHEIVEKEQLIDVAQKNTDYFQHGIGCVEYYKTPVFLAHRKVVLDLAHRVHEYILVAKSQQ